MQKFWKLAQIALWVVCALLVYTKLSTGQQLMVDHPFAFERSERSTASEGWAGR